MRGKNRTAIETILLPEYQSNNVEICLVSLPVCSVRLNNLPDFNQPSLTVDMGYFLQKAPFQHLQKLMKTTSNILSDVTPNNNDTYMW